jgi:hypothetical protein
MDAIHELTMRAGYKMPNTPGAPTIHPPDTERKTLSDLRAVEMILMRLHVSSFPFEFINAHLSGEVVHVFVITEGKPVVFSDDYPLFPSDKLITQLRLIGK